MANKKNKNQYGESQVRVLKGLEAVRLRPGMYIGSVGFKGLHHLVWEIVDNSIDEHLAGHCNEITVTLHEDGSVSIADNGRGIPVEIHSEEGVSTLQVVLTILHAGGKFGGEESGYKVSGGLHGVGSSVVNALSTEFVAQVKRDGNLYEMRFSEGHVTQELTVIGTCGEETGTLIRFKPDASIFLETTEFDYKTIYNRMRENAFLNAGLRIHLVDERQDGSPLMESFYYEGGISDYVKHINQTKKPLHPNVFYVKDEKDGHLVEIAVQYQSDYSESIFSFANNIHTEEGGTHEAGMKSALTKSVTDYIKTHQLIKGTEFPTGEDVRLGATAIISIKTPNPQFEGQTKAKLTNVEMRGVVDSVFAAHFTRYLEENPDVAKVICNKAIESFHVRMAAKKARDMERNKMKNKNSTFSDPDPDKFTPCYSNNPKECEMYIVEGDSAGGSAKQGRDRQTQAILPLRGKVLNVERASLDKILSNKELENIRIAVGTDMADDFDYEKLRHHKIIIMTDADVDGAHIQILLLTFFYRYMRPLIERGHIYIANPPLYKIGTSKKAKYAYSDKELSDMLSGMEGKPTIQRYKGLGEMNPDQLWETTMDPKTRTLYQVTIDDVIETERLFSELMGDSPEARWNHIVDNAQYATLDF